MVDKKKKKKKEPWDDVFEFAEEVDGNAKTQKIQAGYILGRLVEKIFKASGEEVSTESVGFYVEEPEEEDDEDET